MYYSLSMVLGILLELPHWLNISTVPRSILIGQFGGRSRHVLVVTQGTEQLLYWSSVFESAILG